MSHETTITVEVREDHLDLLARTKPMTALAELIWNALDAEATEVRVVFEENELGGLEAVRIVDNGTGLRHDDALIVFRNLGGSWKRQGPRTTDRPRALHGKFGKGRFRAFSLGHDVRWNSVFEDQGQRRTFTVSGKASRLGEFVVSDAEGADAAAGMQVEITNVSNAANLLRGVKANQEVTDTFALYLRQYPGVRIIYDNTPLDPANSERHFTEYALEPMVTENGDPVTAALTVVEWNISGKRGVFLCDAEGFALHNGLPRLHFRGFSYTAYIKSSHIEALERQGLLQAGELSADVRQLLDAARAKLREHFALREAERAQDVLADWREMGLYPYAGEPRDENESNERRIFDIYATHLNQISPDFASWPLQNKRLVLQLIQELVRTEPTRVAHILDSVIEFPEEKEGEILELVQS
ncbi:MAG: hypothetical protein GC168_07625 [Candidatus Hydrogenedens sp.]|nr:hypothetical protein [Candidatus Hydrogenedens sp.]